MSTDRTTPCACGGIKRGGVCSRGCGIENKRKEPEQSLYQRYGLEWRHASSYHRKIWPDCVHCKRRGVTRPATCVDHILPVNRENPKRDARLLDTYNHQSLCHKCHNVKTAAEQSGQYDTRQDLAERYTAIQEHENVYY